MTLRSSPPGGTRTDAWAHASAVEVGVSLSGTAAVKRNGFWTGGFQVVLKQGDDSVSLSRDDIERLAEIVNVMSAGVSHG